MNFTVFFLAVSRWISMYTLLSIYKYITYWRRKTRPHTREETQRRPAARPLGGAEVLVAVRGPSPGVSGGEGKKPDSAVLDLRDVPPRQRGRAERHQRGRPVLGRRRRGRAVGWQNFGKMLLVFGCIGSDFCKKIIKICVLQHFSKSTRFSI